MPGPSNSMSPKKLCHVTLFKTRHPLAGAINRYCARLGGLYPENPMEASRIGMQKTTMSYSH
eukprot:13670326-Ditylum_brightwellii.AAC.1